MHELDVLPFPASPGHGERSVRWRRAALLTALAVGVLAFLAMATSAHANGVPLNNGDVLVGTGNGTVAHFDHSGNLLDTLDNGTGAFYSTGMCTDSNTNLYVTEFGQENISVFDVNGNLTHQTFGSAYNSDPESCTVDASNNIYVGEADGSGTVLKFDTSGNLLASYNPALGGRGTDWVDLAADQCTLYYTSEDSSVHRFDVCTNTQLPDFASGLPGPCYELRIRPNGEVMVACSTEAVRLDTTGNIIQTYPIPGASVLFALNLDPDGRPREFRRAGLPRRHRDRQHPDAVQLEPAAGAGCRPAHRRRNRRVPAVDDALAVEPVADDRKLGDGDGEPDDRRKPGVGQDDPVLGIGSEHGIGVGDHRHRRERAVLLHGDERGHGHRDRVLRRQ